MSALYQAVGTSKQAFHQWRSRNHSKVAVYQSLLGSVMAIRSLHPCISSRKMYSMLQPSGMGRDQFEALCFSWGYRVARKRSPYRTTNSLGVRRFSNLLLGKELTGVNQVWVSDITYYRIGEKFYYVSLVMDLWSRYVVGYSVSERLLTEETSITALKMALGCRKNVSGLILHSDGGGQYYSKEFLSLTKKWGIKNSMSETVYENGASERLNGILKQEYLAPCNPQSYVELKRYTSQAVKRYNERPHWSLGLLTPSAYEALSTEEQKEKKKQKKKNPRTNNSSNSNNKLSSKKVNVF